MNRTSIEWCRTYRADGSFEEGFTTNPIRFLPRIETFGPASKPFTVTMCQKVSPGCTNCYAESITRRFWPKTAGKFPGYTAAGVASGQFLLSERELQQILHHKKPCRLFWGDMTDLFQESVPDEFLDRCFAVAALTPHITHMFLTKRPERMQKYLQQVSDERDMQRWINAAIDIGAGSSARMSVDEEEALISEWPLPNVWLGNSVENQDEADKRIPLLLDTPAAVRFISAEPLLGTICFRPRCESLADKLHAMEHGYASKPMELTGIDWVICGGESGRNARPMHPDWARALRDQCQAASVPFFFKQWGEFSPFGTLPAESKLRGHTWDNGMTFTSVARVGKKAAGALLDGREWREFPEVRA